MMESSEQYANVIIVGDFNIPDIDWNANAVRGNSRFAQPFQDLLDDLYLCQLITTPTRSRSGQQSNIFDLLITNQQILVEFWELNAPLGKSDHLTLDFSLIAQASTVKTSSRYTYFKGNYEEMRNYVRDNNTF